MERNAYDGKQVDMLSPERIRELRAEDAATPANNGGGAMPKYPATVYSHNEALGSYKRFQTVINERDEAAARDRVRHQRLEHLRSFVAFEIHYADRTREEIARGQA